MCRYVGIWALALPLTKLPSKKSHLQAIWAGLWCAALRELGVHRAGQGCPGSTSTQVNISLLSYTGVDLSFVSWARTCWVLQHLALRNSEGSARAAMLQQILGLKELSCLSNAILGALGQALSREGKLFPRLTESFSKYIWKCTNCWSVARELILLPLFSSHSLGEGSSAEEVE